MEKSQLLNLTPEFSTALTVKKSQFSSNSGNKQRFIDLLSEYLEESGFTCLHAPADADVIICRTAMNIFKDKNNVFVTDEARLRLFNAKFITGDTTFESTSLPPISAAAVKLSLRVNHQVETWLKMTCNLPIWDGNSSKDNMFQLLHNFRQPPVRSLKSFIAIAKVAANTTNVAV